MWFAFTDAFGADTGHLSMTIVDTYTGNITPCRIHLKDADGNAIRADPHPFFKDHFVCDGTVELDMPAGRYHYEMERGCEYRPRSGDFSIEAHGNLPVAIELKKMVNHSDRG